MLKGYRTIITMGAGLVYSIAAYFGVVVPTEEQSIITAGVISLAGVVLRLVTDSKVGGK